MLVLSAREEYRDAMTGYARLRFGANDQPIGYLDVPAEHANKLVALLNAATELWEVAQEVADVGDWHGTASKGRCTCLPCRARKVLAKAKGAT